ncbi:MAG: beta-Ala-His dipeptidase [Promethearchaeota archaeon]
MSKLKGLGEPSEFWEYFEQITKIPRCSENEEKVRAFIQQEAERLGFETQVDGIGNLVVRIPAMKNLKKKVVLQCHLDMVCEKNEGISHDFSNDPLNLDIIETDMERWVTAEGTTLGADNGVGICYILALLKKVHNGDLKFGYLGFDLLFTVDEETGLRGAFNIDNDLISGNFLINLDGEEEDSVIVGCAGGRVTIFKVKKENINIKPKKDKVIPIRIFVYGLGGGHSGAEIHLGRGNALKILGEILWLLNDRHFVQLNSINGGNRTNAIPREASAIMFIKEKEISNIKDFISDLISEIKVIYETIEPNFDVTVETLNNFPEDDVIEKNIQDDILNILYTIPNGPLSMHPQIKDLVFTSSNLGVIRTDKKNVVIKLSQRSLSQDYKIVIWEKTVNLFNHTKLEIETIIDSDYPGWTPNFNSKLLSLTKDAYQKLNNKEISIKAIHAGLECGILKEKFPQMDMISFGPKIIGAHSPDEKISIKSVEKIWFFLVSLLELLE